MLVAPFGNGSCAYDTVTGTLHLLAASAGWLLEVAPITRHDAAVELASVSGVPLSEAASHIGRAVDALDTLGLLGRGGTSGPTAPLAGQRSDPPPGTSTGAMHRVLDLGVVLRSQDRALLDVVDAHLGTAQDPSAPLPPTTAAFDLTVGPDGTIALDAVEQWRFPTRTSLLAQLPGVLHDFAIRAAPSLVLHAGGVVTPGGATVLLAGPSTSGKSTLTAALVRARCDLLGDELIGVRPDRSGVVGHPVPIGLDDDGRRLLGLGPSGGMSTDPSELRHDVRRLAEVPRAPDLIVLPEFSPTSPATPRRLASDEALLSLLGSATNLHRTGSIGLATLCELAETVPVLRVVHDDARRAAESILDALV